MLRYDIRTLALAPPVDQSTANSIENAYDNKCLRHLGLRLDVACRSLCSLLLAQLALLPPLAHFALLPPLAQFALLTLARTTRFARTLARTSWVDTRYMVSLRSNLKLTRTYRIIVIKT